ncbi:MAG: orotidine-5'-phosphate decarboxylase [Granulosicoccaceae bacterium]
MIITALDYNNAKDALALADKIDPLVSRVKVGKELFTVAGPALVDQLQAKGFDVFLDLKFHDIPNTVAGALKAAASLGVWMVDVHAFGGPAMLAAARSAITPFAESSGTRVIGVTVLTSMDEAQLAAIGVAATSAQQVLNLASLVKQAGLDGVVCSPKEAGLIRQNIDAPFLTVTPGVRPAATQVGSAGGQADDQRRAMTPADAIAAGSDYLVIGRPITQAVDPLQALHEIANEVQAATKS